MPLMIKNNSQSHKIFFAYRKKKLIEEPCVIKSPKYNFWIPKKKKKKLKKFDEYGVLRIITNKRNIFCTLSNLSGHTYASISSGLLKVKGRKRQAPHIIRATGQLIINQIFKYKKKTLILIHKGRAYEKKKKTLLKTFTKLKKIQILKIQRPAPRSHNGCRPSKIRRK